MAQTTITWEAPEFEYHAKEVSWYWLSIIITTVFLGLTVWQRNFLFGVFIVIAEILILVWAGREPATVTFSIDEAGLTIGEGKHYRHADFEEFSVRENDDLWAHLLLRFKAHLRPLLAIPLPKEKIPVVRRALGSVLSEVEAPDSLFDTIQKIIRF